ncbi:MAG: hypothetical protein Q7T26_04170 [Dehalococcoidia bacterium]|nr:hypothetical protein [Dehalococcoidia bacterium]
MKYRNELEEHRALEYQRWNKKRKFRQTVTVMLILGAVAAVIGTVALLVPTIKPDQQLTRVTQFLQSLSPSTDISSASKALAFPTSDSYAAQPPVALATVTPDAIKLRSELPRDVYEQFYNDFYAGCVDPPRDKLGVAKTWSGTGNSTVIIPPQFGTYFLVLIANPSSSGWRFDSVLDTGSSGKKQSLRVSSTAPTVLTDSQEWCTMGAGVPRPYALEIQSQNLAWTVHLVTSGGQSVLSKAVNDSLSGYYGVCPAVPPVGSLGVLRTWSSTQGNMQQSIEFAGGPPFYFLGVRFEPLQKEWSFESTEINGNRRVAGPKVSYQTGERVNFTATCPDGPGLGHLDIQSQGGDWTIYLIGVRR